MVAFSICLLLSLVALWWSYTHRPVCARCGGRGQHERRCPLRGMEE